MTTRREYRISAPDLDLLERVYGSMVHFNDQRQIFMCRYCRAQRTLHREHCVFRALGVLIDQLQIQESQGPIDAETRPR